MKVLCYGPWRATSVLWQPSPGAWAFTVACHTVFELAPTESPLVAKPLPIDPVADDDERAVVEPWGPPAPVKRRAEVVVVGHAYAPPAKKVTSLVVRLAVGDLEKLLHVYGDSWFTQDGMLTASLSFDKMPLRWDRTAGAPNESNPVGVRMGRDALADTQGRVLVPNLRPMGTWITRRDEVLAPVGLGPIRPTWPSRVERLHWHAPSWDAQRWAERPLPADFDVSYFNVAPADQMLDAIAGNERIVLEHLHPRFPRLTTYLAATSPCVVASLGGVEQSVPVVCDTLVIDSDRGVAFLVWRGHVPLHHPQQEGMVFVTASRLGASPTATVEGASAPVGAALPFQGGGAVETLVGGGVPLTTALPFRPVAEPTPEIVDEDELLEAAEDEDSEVTAIRGIELAPGAREAFENPPTPVVPEPRAPSAPVVVPAPPVVAPSPPLVAPLPPVVVPAPVEVTAPRVVAATPPLVVPPPRESEPVRPRAASPRPKVASSIEQCAAVAARLAAPGANRAAILHAEELTPEGWEALHLRWLAEIEDELQLGNHKLVELVREQRRALERSMVDLETQQLVDLLFDQHQQLLVAYDTAYVAALEELRGPITPRDFAQLSRAAERGEAAPVLAELGLPEGSTNRIRRVWRARMAKDPKVAAEVRAALQAKP